jgi:hypothetical protein
MCDIRKGEGGRGNYLCSELVWENLNTVTDEESGPSRVVKYVVQEDEENLGGSGGLDGGLYELSSGDGPGDESYEHTTGSEQEQWTTTEFIDEETHGKSGGEVDDVEDTVDLESELRVQDTGSLENIVHVVGDESVTGPLGEETEGYENDKTTTVTPGLEEFDPSIALVFLLELDGVADFTVFDLDELILSVSTSMCLGENVKSLLIFALGDQVTWGFWDHPDGNQLDDGWCSLNHGWNSP